MENTKFVFDVNAVYTDDRHVKIIAPFLKDYISTTIPPLFKNGISGYWSPEHLFLASIASCFAHTFHTIAELSKFDFECFSCSISGEAEKNEGIFAFHKAILSPILIISSEEQRQKAESVLQKTERNCIVKNSIKTEIIIESKILVNERAKNVLSCD